MARQPEAALHVRCGDHRAVAKRQWTPAPRHARISIVGCTARPPLLGVTGVRICGPCSSILASSASGAAAFDSANAAREGSPREVLDEDRTPVRTRR